MTDLEKKKNPEELTKTRNFKTYAIFLYSLIPDILPVTEFVKLALLE